MAYGFNSDKSKVNVLPLTGGTLSGNIRVSSDADVGYNKVPATEQSRSYQVIDKNGNGVASFIGVQRDGTGRKDCQLVAWGRDASNNTVWNSIVVGCTKEGNPYYSLTSAKDFRNALGATDGVWPASQIPNLDAAKITSGTFATARIPNLAASKITSDALALARGGTGADNSSVAINKVFAGPSSGSAGNASWRALVAADIPVLAASKITSGTFDSARIPNLAASKITSGTFDDARIPGLAATKITSGIFGLARGGTGVNGTSTAINKVFAGPSSGSAGNATFRSLVANDIPNLPAGKITSGTLGVALIPNISASKITSGTLGSDRLPTVPVSKGGTGTTGVTKTSGVVTAANNVTVSASEYTQWGKIAMLLVEFKNNANRSGSFKIGGIADTAKRPARTCYGFNSYGVKSIGVTAGGEINASVDCPVGITIVAFFVYIIS